MEVGQRHIALSDWGFRMNVMHGDKPIQKYLNYQLYIHFYDLWFKMTLN